MYPHEITYSVPQKPMTKIRTVTMGIKYVLVIDTTPSTLPLFHLDHYPSLMPYITPILLHVSYYSYPGQWKYIGQTACHLLPSSRSLRSQLHNLKILPVKPNRLLILSLILPLSLLKLLLKKDSHRLLGLDMLISPKYDHTV